MTVVSPRPHWALCDLCVPTRFVSLSAETIYFSSLIRMFFQETSNGPSPFLMP